jgi:ABC-type Fe3+ transport system permease subunit
VSGSTETLPHFVFGQIHQGPTPLTNAIAAMVLLLTIAILLIGRWALSRQSRASGEGGRRRWRCWRAGRQADCDRQTRRR